jgi:hypothetical protein
LKTTASHFEYFKSEARRWLDKLGVTDYRIDFVHESLADAYAKVGTKSVHKVARIGFNTEWRSDDPRPLNKASIADTAKHEAIHMVTADLVSLANSRFVTPDEVLEAEERLVRRLQRAL